MSDVRVINFDGKFICTDEDDEKWDFEDIILLQFTGIKDKNGTEIYEGDVVKLKTVDGFKDSISDVIWRDASFKVEQVEFRDAMDGDAWVDLWVERNGIEIIGNIYENLELLK